jgi:hypothetical protein
MCACASEITGRNYGICVTEHVFDITRTFVKAAAKLGRET